MTALREPSIHGCALVVGERGVLIRGASGSGKSALTLALIARARAGGLFAALVADDRVFLSAAGGRLLASGARGFEGLIERRGEGLVEAPYEPRIVVRLVVDLSERGCPPPRWPEEDAQFAQLHGVDVPRLALDSDQGAGDGADAVLRRLAAVT